MDDGPDPVILETRPEEWDEVIRNFPERTVFHMTGWLRAVESAYGPRMALYRAEVGGECVGAWPAFTLRKGIFRILGSPLPGWGTVYLGPLFAAGADQEAVLQAFQSTRPYRKVSFAFCKVRDPSNDIDLSVIGYERQRRYKTFLLDLEQSEEALWKGVKSRFRTYINKAGRLGFEVVEETDDSFVEDFWAMAEDVYAKSEEKPNYTKEFLYAAWKHLAAKGQAIVLTARFEGRRAASLFLPHDDRVAYYWAGVTSDEFKKQSPSKLLQWEAIKRLKERGFRTYDFVSVYGGPGRFKKSFGPIVAETSTTWERCSSPLIAWLRRAYEKYARSKKALR